MKPIRSGPEFAPVLWRVLEGGDEVRRERRRAAVVDTYGLYALEEWLNGQSLPSEFQLQELSASLFSRHLISDTDITRLSKALAADLRRGLASGSAVPFQEEDTGFVTLDISATTDPRRLRDLIPPLQLSGLRHTKTKDSLTIKGPQFQIDRLMGLFDRRLSTKRFITNLERAAYIISKHIIKPHAQDDLFSDQSHPPDPPAYSVGSILQPTLEGFELATTENPQNEVSDPKQQTIYRQLFRRIKRLESAMVGMENSHADLVAEFRDYQCFVGDSIAAADIAGLWSAGAGLAQFIAALEPNRLIDTMTSPVEPAILAELRSLIVDHMMFVEGTSVGREMRERVERFKTSGENTDVLTDRAMPVLEALLAVTGLLAIRAKHLATSLYRAMDVLRDKSLYVAVTGSELTRNAVLAIGALIYQNTTEINTLAVLAGFNDPNVTNLAILFFRDHSSAILALAASDPQMQIWTDWIITTIERHSRKI